MAHELVPLRGVIETGGEYFALSNEPWLEFVSPQLPRLAGCLAEFRYSASYWDDPVRPIFRFQTKTGLTTEFFAPAPVLGCGIWVGRIPRQVQSLVISPTDKTGSFSFTVEAVRRRSWWSLIAQGVRHNPRSSRSALFTLALGWREEADNNLAWATGSTRLADYKSWYEGRFRQPNVKTTDVPRTNWQAAEPIHLWLALTSEFPALNATISSLMNQIFPHWILHVIGRPLLDLPDDGRIRFEVSSDCFGENTGLIGSLGPGEELRPYALACVYEAASRHADAQVFYGDEEEQRPDGSLLPIFKPAWDAMLHRQRPLHGRCIFLRGPLSNFTPEAKREFLGRGTVVGNYLSQMNPRSIKAIRRIMMTSPMPWQVESHKLEVDFSRNASVSIIIPTKDGAEHLMKLVRSIRDNSQTSTPRLIIVDNGSSDSLTKNYLKRIGKDEDVTVVEHPGAFNFSSICNAGAALSLSDVLVFLNNDMEVESKDWLERIVAWALRPDVGAVGAKLTYPNGLIQHIGVLLGMGGSAGHFGSFDPADAPGWAYRNMYVHKVSAVTGACLAVERTKFYAVGGFDEVNLPIELSDVDLCLRLAEHGWTAIVDPEVRLIHEESATRGRATFRRLDVYRRERAYFIDRWRHVLRADPYFHPALSLFHWRPALG
jgi:GT2 family glycosyltransferase